MFLIAVVSIVERHEPLHGATTSSAKIIGGQLVRAARIARTSTSATMTEETWRELRAAPAHHARRDVAARRRRAARRTCSGPSSGHDSLVDAVAVRRQAAPGARVHGDASDYFDIKKMAPVSGRLFSPQEYELGTPVDRHRPGRRRTTSSPTSIRSAASSRSRGIPYTVVGVLEKQGSVFGISLDKFVDRAAQVAAQPRTSTRTASSTRS